MTRALTRSSPTPTSPGSPGSPAEAAAAQKDVQTTPAAVSPALRPGAPSAVTAPDMVHELISSARVFASLAPSHLQELAKVVRTEAFPAGETIVRQGEVGDTFYVMYSGTAKVYVRAQRGADDQFNAEVHESWGECVQTLGAGDDFGELALVGDGMRNATVLTTAATTVLCIDKQTYESTIRTAYEADITERVAFLRGVFLFEGWADEALRRIAHVIRPRELPAGRTVVRQGGHSNSVYFIRSGTCRVVRWVARQSAAETSEEVVKKATSAFAVDIASAASIARRNPDADLGGSFTYQPRSGTTSAAGSPLVGEHAGSGAPPPPAPLTGSAYGRFAVAAPPMEAVAAGGGGGGTRGTVVSITETSMGSTAAEPSLSSISRPTSNLGETDPTLPGGGGGGMPAAPKARDDDPASLMSAVQSRAAQVMRLDPSLRSSLQYRAVDADDKWADDDDDDDDEEGDGGGAGGAPPVFVNAVDRRLEAPRAVAQPPGRGGGSRGVSPLAKAALGDAGGGGGGPDGGPGVDEDDDSFQSDHGPDDRLGYPSEAYLVAQFPGKTIAAGTIEPVTVCTLRPPQYFGELGLLLNTGHTASVVTVAPTEIYMLSKFDWKRQVPGATRGAMVSAMLSHAKAAYEFSNVVRSISIGLSDESFTLPDNLSHFLAEEEKKQEAAAAQQQQQQQHGALGGGGGGGVPSAVRIVSEPPRGGGGGGGGGGSYSVGPAEVAATPRTREQERKDAEEEAGRLRRELLLPLFTPSIIQATAVGLLIPVLPLRALHLSAGLDSVVGVVVSGRGAGLIVGSPIAGVGIAAFGLRRGLVLGLGLSAVAAACGAFSTNVWPLLTTRLVAGVGLAFFQVGRQMYLSLCVPASHRGTVSSLIAGTTRLGTTIGPAAGGVMADASGTESAFLLEAALFVAAACIIHAFMTLGGRDDTGGKPLGAGGGKAAAPPGEARRCCAGLSFFSHEALLMAPVLFVLAFVRATRELALPLKAEELGVTKAQIGGITAASFAIDTVLVPAAGYVMDKYGRRWAGAPALALTAVGFCLLAAADTPGSTLASSIALGLGMGMSNGWIQTVGADLAPAGQRPQFLGVWNMVMGVGTAAGPVAIGTAAQLLGVGTSCLVASLVAALGAAWYAFVATETLQSYPKEMA